MRTGSCNRRKRLIVEGSGGAAGKGGWRTWRAFFSLASSSSRFRFCRDRAHTSASQPVFLARGEGAGVMAHTTLSRLVRFSERRGGGLGQGRPTVLLQSTRRYHELPRSSAVGFLRQNPRQRGGLTHVNMSGHRPSLPDCSSPKEGASRGWVGRA